MIISLGLIISLSIKAQVVTTDTLEYKEVIIGSYSSKYYYMKTDNTDGTTTEMKFGKDAIIYTSKMSALKSYTDAGWQIQLVWIIPNEDTKLNAQALSRTYEVYLLKRKLFRK